MTERICLITGTTNGIGAVTARRLAEMGYSVVMACRDPQRGARLAREIEQRTGNGRIEVLDCDLASLASVRRATEAFSARHGRLDVLVNNAGIMTTRYRTCW
jgi:NAD(P)-dependent dehydrogenase (short-subunit alcohol dehydrogenase family)